MNSATNTQETADVQTETGATAKAEVLQGALGACQTALLPLGADWSATRTKPDTGKIQE